MSFGLSYREVKKFKGSRNQDSTVLEWLFNSTPHSFHAKPTN